MKKLRLLLFEKCNRDCEFCCNKQWDLKKLPVEKDFTQYDEIILTGGEPMLDPFLILKTIKRIREQNSRVPIYLYTAKIDDWSMVLLVLSKLNGITITLHEQADVNTFLYLSERIKERGFKEKSLRVNIFKGVKVFSDISMWKVKRNIVWLNPCPLPENEVFKRL